VEDREANDAESDRMGDFQLIAEEHRQPWLTSGYAVLAYDSADTVWFKTDTWTWMT